MTEMKGKYFTKLMQGRLFKKFRDIEIGDLHFNNTSNLFKECIVKAHKLLYNYNVDYDSKL